MSDTDESRTHRVHALLKNMEINSRTNRQEGKSDASGGLEGVRG